MKAELFSKSLQDARRKEAEAMKTLEDERGKWNQAFVSKSIDAEQLQRELSSTVDALQREKHLRQSFENSFSSENEQYSLHHHHPPAMIGNIQPSSSSSSSSSSSPASRNIVYPSPPKNIEHHNAAFQDIVASMQEENKRLLSELSSKRIEIDALQRRLEASSNDVHEFNTTKHHLMKSLSEAEGELQFRVSQVRRFFTIVTCNCP